MPIYEYACTPCGKVFEELVIRSSDEAEIACPACRSRKISRLISRTAAARTRGSDRGAVRAPSCGPVG